MRNYCEIARNHGKKIRLATKSVRVPKLIQQIMDLGEGTIQGLMCFSSAEARFLCDEYGFDDIMIAYPLVQEDYEDVWYLLMKDKNIQVK